MPKRTVLALPVIYAVIGAVLWYVYAENWLSVGLWIALHAALFLSYRWLIGKRAIGLMMRFHLGTMAIGMLLLFYVLMPFRQNVSTDQILLELILMITGTFFCAVSLFSLLHMVIRKLIRDPQIRKRMDRLGQIGQNT